MAGTGYTTLDFGAFPGAADTSVAVTGLAAIAAAPTGFVEAWVYPTATSDHSADEHLVENIRVVAGTIIAGTGFTIYGYASTPDIPSDAIDGTFSPKPRNGHRLYGQWTVAYAWT
jgi:hypothetical protein